jgi:hypothetical protein
MYLNSDLIFH